jgi:hypothetical protein
MDSRKRSSLLLVLLSLLVTALMLAFAPSAQLQQNATVSTTTRGGLQTVTFDTFQGKVIVNLPDDMAAGDTISGTVIVEPKKQSLPDSDKTGEDKSLSMELLFDTFKSVNIPTSGGSLESFTVKIPTDDKSEKTGGQIKLALKDKGGPPIQSTNVPFAPPIGSILTSSKDSKFALPTMAQQGRPVEIPGPFDGSFENTKVTLGDEEIPVLAESPRKAIFRSPTDFNGLVYITCKEGNVETKGEFRNIGVRLSAPKTNLIKGESTTLNVKVLGLEGIKEDVPLHLENASPAVVRMENGDAQTFKITPSTIQPDGTFTTTRTITGQQAGSFSVTATVVVFNRCLQDDAEPARMILWNTFTGDYIFCSGLRNQTQVGAAQPQQPIIFSTIDYHGGALVAIGDIELTRQGAANLTLQSSNTDRRVLINLSGGSFPPSGSATIETFNPKQTFQITDRDMRNNACRCK